MERRPEIDPYLRSGAFDPSGWSERGGSTRLYFRSWATLMIIVALFCGAIFVLSMIKVVGAMDRLHLVKAQPCEVVR